MNWLSCEWLEMRCSERTVFTANVSILSAQNITIATMTIDSNYWPFQKRSQFIANWRWVFCLLLVSLLLSPARIPAQECADTSPTETSTTSDDAGTSVAGPLARVPMTPAQRQKIAVAALMLAGVVAVLLLLFLWMLWWSRRTRRLLREPLPAAGKGDELWYMKAKRDLQKAAERRAAEKDTPAPPHSSP